MSFDDHGRVPIRSYRVVFRLERRIFEVDRFRLPFPYGVEVRALVYAAVSYLCLAILSSLPLVGGLMGLLPAPVHWGLLPIGVVLALLKLRIDGRPPHKVLGALLRWATRPKHLAGLRPCPSVGSCFTPVSELWFRPDWRACSYRKAVVSGPAMITLRYPATIEVRRSLHDRMRRRRAEEPAGGQLATRQLVIHGGSARPMFVGKTISIPAGGEVRFR
jgi:hypothetical protein